MAPTQKRVDEPEVNVMIYETNTIQEGNRVIDQVIWGEVLYTVSILRIAVYLRQDPDLYMVILDNGVEINMIQSVIAAKLGLIVTWLNHRMMMSANQSKSKFLGIAKDTPVNVGGLYY